MSKTYLEKMFSLEGQVVAITGGGGVLGGALAVGLSQAGAKIAVLNRTQKKADRIVNEIKKIKGTAMAFSADVLDKKNMENAIQSIIKEFGMVDVLINCAGGNQPTATASDQLRFMDIPQEPMQAVLNINFLGTFIPCQVFAQFFSEKKVGHIINISSMAALRPLTKVVAYSAAKSAVNNFTQWLAVHLSQNYSSSIRVNAIAPGFFLTEQNRFLLTDEKSGELTARGKTIIAHTPLARFGEAEELVSTALWLLSPASRFVHGTVIPVDGGFSAFSGV